MIQLQNISKHYDSFTAVDDVSLHIKRGEIFGLIGPSGAGKSTLLRLMNLLETPSKGSVLINDTALTKLSKKELSNVRKSIGMIFQHFNLLANKTVFDNVAIALQLANYPKKKIHQRVLECLSFVGLSDQQSKYPAQLSGGQKQRVAIARALANNPQVLLCDEPTSSLDPTTTAEILNVLQNINEKLHVTIVIVSHEMEVIQSICTRVCVLDKGSVYETIDIKPTGVLLKSQHPQTFVDALKGADD